MDKKEINLDKYLALEDKLKELEKTIKDKDSLIDGLTKKNAASEEQFAKFRDQIDRLKDQNTDLFLRVSQPVPTETEPVEETPSQEETITIEDLF